MHFDARWLEGVVGRECELPVVLSTMVRTIGRTAEDIVPIQDVLLVRGCPYEWRGRLLHAQELLGEALVSSF